MTIKYEVRRYSFEPDPALVDLIRRNAAAKAMSIQDIVDACTLAGFDGRATAMEIGILLMDKELRPAIPTLRLCGSTVVEIAARPTSSDMKDGDGPAPSTPGQRMRDIAKRRRP